jgi:hypothetical protein
MILQISSSPFGLDNFKPLDLNISNYKDMENKYISLKERNCLRLWQSSRLSINEGINQVLITKPVQELLKMVEDRFISKTEFWDCRLVSGLSGCGKSIAFAIAAAYLANHCIQVFLFRSGSEFQSKYEDFFLSRKQTESFVVVLIDQIDKKRDFMSILRIGSRVRSCAFLGCGSGNILIEHSSSDTVVFGETFEFNPILPLSSFRVIFSGLLDESRYVNESQQINTVKEMLNFHPKHLLDIYVGANGHFLPVMIIRKSLNDPSSQLSDVWKLTKSYFAASMRDFLFKQAIPNFAVLLHYHLFINQSSSNANISAEFDSIVDHRYIWKSRMHSSLFAQAYQEILFEYPLNFSQIKSLHQVHIEKYDNHVMLGFFIERIL